ncbi:putative disease resistance RPP13-like protein 3 [Cornus florida]|uniref:putative disease resistance RPP13-like protein 3 n=1 Tax=Cornus florida TaxID=4283 RepID=UPI0028A08BE4|nr:putative disease resistance RPP13-like protein 3 [Cornus florida]
MAESAAFLVLDKLAPILLEEVKLQVKLFSGVREEVEYIRAEFERMTAFLRVADSMEDSDKEIKVWVKQVRDVAHHTEDVLDVFMLRGIKQLHHHQHPLRYDSRGDALLVKEAELVGIDKRKKELIGLLVNQTEDRLKVVSVVGMGGLGKTTLVKKVYDDAALKKQFESHAWLTVSESPKMGELLKDMIQQLYREINQPVPQELERMDRLKQAINEFLQQRSYLVVLDDIWNIDAWEAVKYAFLDNNSKSQIMLTTRFGDIASTSCTETGGNVYSLNPLSLEDAWTLFCRKAFPGKASCPRHLEDISRSILKRCEGLPLAIVTIGGVLATKNQSRIDEWHMLHRSLEVNNKLQNMKNILSLSYNDLPWHLKICFLYLSIFPEDHEIECMRLIRLWTAEGFVQVGEDGLLTIEEVAEGYVYDLLNRSLIQVTEKTIDGRARTCRIHDLLREIISIPKSREQNVVTIAGEQNTRGKVQRLSIHNETFGIVQQSKRLSQLRSLFMFGVRE